VVQAGKETGGFIAAHGAWLIRTLRQTTPIGTPSSACFRMNAFFASENLLAFVVLHSSSGLQP